MEKKNLINLYPTLSVAHFRATEGLFKEWVFRINKEAEDKGWRSFHINPDGSYLYTDKANEELIPQEQPTLKEEADAIACGQKYLDKLKQATEIVPFLQNALGTKGIQLLPDMVYFDRIERVFRKPITINADNKLEGDYYWRAHYVMKLRPQADADPVPVQGRKVEIDFTWAGNILRVYSNILPTLAPKKVKKVQIPDLEQLLNRTPTQHPTLNTQPFLSKGVGLNTQNSTPNTQPFLDCTHYAYTEGYYHPVAMTSEGVVGLSEVGVDAQKMDEVITSIPMFQIGDWEEPVEKKGDTKFYTEEADFLFETYTTLENAVVIVEIPENAKRDENKKVILSELFIWKEWECLNKQTNTNEETQLLRNYGTNYMVNGMIKLGRINMPYEPLKILEKLKKDFERNGVRYSFSCYTDHNNKPLPNQKCEIGSYLYLDNEKSVRCIIEKSDKEVSDGGAGWWVGGPNTTTLSKGAGIARIHTHPNRFPPMFYFTNFSSFQVPNPVKSTGGYETPSDPQDFLQQFNLFGFDLTKEEKSKLLFYFDVVVSYAHIFFFKYNFYNSNKNYVIAIPLDFFKR